MRTDRQIIDISMTISPGATVYPGDPEIEMEKVSSIDAGDSCNVTRLGWTTHLLTHLDAPRHFLKDGRSMDEIPLSRFISEALLVEVDGDAIGPAHLPPEADLRGLAVLFKTRNSRNGLPQAFDENHVYLSPEAATILARAGANLIGIDSLSIERHGDETHPAHMILLGNDVLILEGIDLANVRPGRYTLIALPLKIAGGDGSPVRAVLLPAD